MKKRKIVIFLTMFAMILVILYNLGEKHFEAYYKYKESNKLYQRHYVMITDGKEEEFWNKVYESAYEEGKTRGIYVERFGENLAENYEKNELLKLSIQACADGIIVPGDEKEDTIELINQAVDKGIPVITVMRDSTASRRQCFVGNNSYQIGQEYGKQVLELLDDTDKNILILLDENRTDIGQNLVLLGIRETLEELGKENSILVDTKTVDGSQNFSPEESIRNIFLDSEKIPDILICLNEVYTRCAYQAAVDYNKVGIVKILGYYDSETILHAIEKQIIYASITLDTEQMGKLCVQALEEYMETGYSNTYMAVDTRLITEYNVKELLTTSEGKNE